MNPNYIIIPNGFHQPIFEKGMFSEVGIKHYLLDV